MYIAQAGLLDAPVTALPGVPARFLGDYRARYHDDPESMRVLYGVLALQVVLAAIARSDGTRVGVRNQIFEGDGLALTADRSVLGRPVTIDPRSGDVRSCDIAIVRVRDGAEVSVTTQTV
jgi:branched-chain amino acid transport system substrate-binding protein